MPHRTQQILIFVCLTFSILIVCGMVYLVHDTMADFASQNSVQTMQAAINESDQGDIVDFEIVMPEVETVQRPRPPMLLSEARPDLFKKRVKSSDKSSKPYKTPTYHVPTEIKVTYKDTLATGIRVDKKRKCGKCKILSEAASCN